MAKQDKKQAISDVKQAGIEIKEELRITAQAQKVIERIDNFPVDHFKKWWRKHYGQIDGGTIMKYLIVDDGILRAEEE